MKKAKRIMAWAGIILLIVLYLITFILGIAGNESTQNMFMASVVCTVIVPCLMYAMMLIARVLERKDTPENPDSKDKPSK